MPIPAPQWVASGNIRPSRFVSQPLGTGFTVEEANANDKRAIGISMEGTEAAPVPNASVYAATDGHNLKVYGVGEVCLLRAGSGGWSAGNRLISDVDGNGVPAGTGALNQHIGAIAFDNATEGALTLVQVVLFDTVKNQS